jgi:putative SOS response-associated peptidase YedK
MKPQALAELLNLRLQVEFSPLYQARPGMQLPVIVQPHSVSKKPGIHPVLISAHWGCQTEAATMSIHAFPMDRILTQSPFNRWIHTQRCLIPVNCFFGRNKNIALGPEDNDTFLIRILQSRVFLLGGLYAVERNVRGVDSHTFLVLTTQSADVLQPLMDQMPVVMLPENIETWLASDHLIDIMHLADRSGDHWFDYFAVSSNILTPGMNSKNLLKPISISLREQEAREHKLKAIDVKQDRFDRRGSKW